MKYDEYLQAVSRSAYMNFDSGRKCLRTVRCLVALALGKFCGSSSHRIEYWFAVGSRLHNTRDHLHYIALSFQDIVKRAPRQDCFSFI